MGDEWNYPKLPSHKTIRILFPVKYHKATAFRLSDYERYGTVRSRRYDIVKNNLECQVEFEDEGVVDKILSDGYIYINDQRIKVEPMTNPDSKRIKIEPMTTPDSKRIEIEPMTTPDSKRIKIEPMTTPDSNLASTMNNDQSIIDNELNLTGLNDDCLRSIFREVGIRTLWSLANVCLRFNDLAKEVFRLKYKDSEIQSFDVSMNDPISLPQFEASLKTFGSSIRQLRIGSECEERQLTDVLLQIDRNCPNIKSLSMPYVAIGSDTISLECRSVFSRLESLYINFSGDNTNYSDILQKKVLPKLTSLTVSVEKYEHEHLESCFAPENNWQLEQLNILTEGEIALNTTGTETPMLSSSHLFPLICERYANISILNIEFDHADDNFQTNVLQLGRLKRLRNLRLDFNGNDPSPLLDAILQNGIQLKLLNIYNGVIGNDAMVLLSRFETLHKLEIVSSHYDEDDLIQLVKELPTLSQLIISLDYIPSSAANMIDTITSIISNGKNLSHLNVMVNKFSEITSIGTNDYNAILKIVEQRVVPVVNLTVIITGFYGPKNVAHYITIASSPELLKLQINYGDTSMV
ncbi:uncharacterized protein LOC119085812 [Bradysia coprophila]|uniref:uncharacterized protein LOC119085812 n=1 Tax=Bradysia coprophila TaxID=38358 RepID=UPI00187DCD76|nr:uncharacterized protein LOC119085812 [Bradysia coprophila]